MNDSKKVINELISLASAIQKLYQKLYYLEINNKKDTQEYKKILEILKDAVDVETNEYQKLRTNTKVIDESLEVLGFILSKRQLFYSIENESLPFFRVNGRLFDLTYDVDYQKSYLSEFQIKLIENFREVEDFIIDNMQEDYQNRLFLKEQICGMLSKFGKITKPKKYQKKEIIEQKYVYSYYLGFVEPIFLGIDFDINSFNYPPHLKQGDYSYVDEKQYLELKQQKILTEIGNSMMGLLFDKDEKIAYLTNKAYFLSTIESLSLLELDSLQDVYLATIKNPLASKKPNLNSAVMIQTSIDKTINKKLREYGISQLVRKFLD